MALKMYFSSLFAFMVDLSYVYVSGNRKKKLFYIAGMIDLGRGQG